MHRYIFYLFISLCVHREYNDLTLLCCVDGQIALLECICLLHLFMLPTVLLLFWQKHDLDTIGCCWWCLVVSTLCVAVTLL